MKIALAQINPIIGDLAHNVSLIRRDIARAKAENVDLIVFPELSVVGYPPKDLLLKPAVLAACEAAIHELAAECIGVAALIGYPAYANRKQGRLLHNIAALCVDGKIASQHVKSLLPTYDVFDEHRYFEPCPADGLYVSEYKGVRLGISICEDLWAAGEHYAHHLYHRDPIQELADLGCDVMVNCSASPFTASKHQKRQDMMAQVAAKHQTPLVFVNQIGGNDELIFDGQSCAFDAAGQRIAQAKAFEEDFVIVEIDPKATSQPNSDQVTISEVSEDQTLADIYHALVLGIRDYCRKCGFKSIVLGLSGGIDSALTCALCVAAIGSENVRGVTMPSRYSSEGSKSDAKDLADRLNIAFHEVPIGEPHQVMESLLQPVFASEGKADPDVTEENIQARLRGVIMMAMSNKFGSLLVTTGNKSELAVGYCTLYGDMCGGLAVLSDVPKTIVYDLSNWINTPACPLHQQFNSPVIPEPTITKPPSAELRPDQVDQDSLPEYEVLDDIIERYVELEHSAAQIIEATGYDSETVFRMVQLIDRNEYKRKQAAPGLKVTSRAFGFGRRMPIAQRWDNRKNTNTSIAPPSPSGRGQG